MVGTITTSLEPIQNETNSQKSIKKGLTKSTSETVLKKTNRLDHELLELERDDGKRHSKEWTNSLHEYTKKIEQIQAKNRRLEEELSFDKNLSRDDEQVTEKLSNLYVQGNNFMVRLELERKELNRLNTLIEHKESILHHEKSKLQAITHLHHDHTLLGSKLRKMENEIDRRIVKMNEKLNINRKLRQEIDEQKNERARMDGIYTKIATEGLTKHKNIVKLSEEVEKIRQEIQKIEQEIEDLQQEGEEWEKKCDQRASVLLQELKEITSHQCESQDVVDIDKYKYLGENELMKQLNTSQENLQRTRSNHNRRKGGQEKEDLSFTKYHENRSVIEKIHEVSGTTTVSEMIEAFNQQEVDHFERIQKVNQLAEEIENHRQISTQLREEIGKLKQRKDSVDVQRMNRIESLKARLQITLDQKKHKEASNQQLQWFLATLKPTIMTMHSRIGCPETHDNDLKRILGDVETQIIKIIQDYSIKMETKLKMEKEQESTVLSEESEVNDVETSPSKEKSTQSSRSRSLSTHNPMLRIHGNRDHSPERQYAPTVSLHPLDQSGSSGAGSTSTTFAPLLNFLPKENETSAHEARTPNGGPTVASLVAREQPYRYNGVKPPHLSVEELKKKDNVEEEYPLTYDELKVKVWRQG